jgi:hypothetical protein
MIATSHSEMFIHTNVLPLGSHPRLPSQMLRFFHATQSENAAPKVRQLIGTIHLGVAINEENSNAINVALRLK